MWHLCGLRVEPLEPRDNPATFGVAWPDAEHLTLSFAPDGTAVGGRANAFPGLLSQLGPQARLDVLRSFQAWAAHANVNFGLVADDGSAFGVGGAVQGDPRFGDVRVGGVPLAADVLAVTAPYGPFSNYSGDVTVNTAAGYGTGGPDLGTVLLQEAGHALGVGNSPDPGSAMYEFYQGPRPGLSAGDIAAIQSLYGPRVADRWEGPGGNGTRASASPYTGPLAADLTTAADVDVYTFTAGLLTHSVTVNLAAAGRSLLTARVELLDADGDVVAAAQATDPAANDVTLATGSLRAFAKYYVRVSAARADDFGTGAYDLGVTQHSILSDLTGLVTDLLTEVGLNDTRSSATTLQSRSAAVGSPAEFVTEGGYGSAADVDVYRITVPPTPDGTPANLLATVWGQAGAVLNSWIAVEDTLGNPLAAEVLTADGNTTTVQVRGVAPGQTIFLELSSDTHARGRYTLSTDLRPDVVAVPTGPTRTVAAGAVAGGGLFLPQTGQVHFVLSADDAGVEMVVTAADGTVAATLTAAAGRSRSLDVLLPAGRYSLRFRSLNPSTHARFHLAAVIVTDPVGVTPADPTETPQPTSPPPTEPPTPPPPPPTTPPEEYTPIPFTTPDDEDGGDEGTMWY